MILKNLPNHAVFVLQKSLYGFHAFSFDGEGKRKA